MPFELRDTPAGTAELWHDGAPAPLPPLDAHALADLEYALACWHGAIGPRCAAETPAGGHSCDLWPGHDQNPGVAGYLPRHACRACRHQWTGG
jgi:hypothetical protein